MGCRPCLMSLSLMRLLVVIVELELEMLMLTMMVTKRGQDELKILED